ncbi:hypothetical protein LSUE1_G005243, partial [Lachnellula suecica]
MSRDPYRSSAGDLGRHGRGGERWDSERFAMERDRERFQERFEERDARGPPRGGGFGGGRPRERSVDEVYERDRWGPRGFEDDRYERRERDYYDEPRYERERPPWERERERGPSITIEKEREREYYSPSPPRRAPARPGFLRRQSSLDTFDRKNTLSRFVEREEYGPPARYNRDREEMRPPALTPIPLPKTRALPPPRRFAEQDYYEEIKVAEPDFYGDEDFRGYPERVREREIIRRRRRSRSKSRSRSRSRSRETTVSRSRKGTVKGGSVRASSRHSSSSGGSFETVKSEFPKKGKTRMPGRLVDKRAIIDLGYPFEEEGETVIIQKALGRENIDEVIKLSEDYKVTTQPVVTTSLTTYLFLPEIESVHGGRSVHGGHSEAGTVVEEHRTEVFT